jgi:hypothetical protein
VRPVEAARYIHRSLESVVNIGEWEKLLPEDEIKPPDTRISVLLPSLSLSMVSSKRSMIGYA